MPNPASGSIQQEYVDHLTFDSIVAGVFGPGLFVGATPSFEYMVNLLGARSGVGISTPWGTPTRSGLQKAQYNDSNSGGTVTYAATTATDTAKAWVVNQWTGRTVISIGTGSGVTFGRITSNTATVITIGSWNNGTPSASAFYTIVPALPSGANNVLFRDSWNQGVVRQDGNSQSA